MRELRRWLHARRRPLRYRLLPALLQNQQRTPAQLREQQQRDLENVVRFAAAHTAYYRQRFAGHLPPAGEPLDPGRLPPLTKDDLRRQRDALLADTADRDRVRLGYTGGSTGTPLSFYYDEEKMERMRAGMIRSYQWSGWQPGEKILNFWGARQDLKHAGLARRYRDFIAAEKTIGAWEYDDAKLNAWTRFIRRYRPVLLQGYASIIADVARFVLDNRIKLPPLKGVYSTAEVLYDWQRETMEAAFGCKVYNQYGCREIPNIALECRQGNMHVFSDMVYLESVNSDGEDRLLITSLTNYLMPMIRYENGDSGRLKAGDCACGSPFPMMEMGVCRDNDFLRTPGGRKIAPSYFNRLLDGLGGIRRYRFLQTEADAVRLQIEADTRLAEATARALRDRLASDTGGGLRLVIEYPDRIERSRSGKHRFVICALDSAGDRRAGS